MAISQNSNLETLLSNIIGDLAEHQKLLLLGYAQALHDAYYDNRLTPDEEEELKEAKAQVARGEVITLEEVMKNAHI